MFKYKERKSIFKIFLEIIGLSIKHRKFAFFYFSRHLYRKDVKNIYDYHPSKILYKLSEKFNNRSAEELLNNKLCFDILFSKYNINVAKVLFYNFNKNFYINNHIYENIDINKFKELLDTYILEKSKNKALFIKKSFDTYGGQNIYQVTKNDVPLDEEYLYDLHTNITDSSYLFQEVVIQHDLLNQLNPSCVNTIRIDTFTDKYGTSEIMSALIRFSINNLVVDNTSSGGCFVGVDINSGRLKKMGYTSIAQGGGKLYSKHPVTNVIFENYEIPFFKEAKELVLKCARLVPVLRVVGWDIAISPDGPVLIEGNCGYDMTGNEKAYGGYRQNPVFQKMYAEAKERKYI